MMCVCIVRNICLWQINGEVMVTCIEAQLECCFRGSITLNLLRPKCFLYFPSQNERLSLLLSVNIMSYMFVV